MINKIRSQSEPERVGTTPGDEKRKDFNQNLNKIRSQSERERVGTTPGDEKRKDFN